MAAERFRNAATWLLNPFHYLSGESALPLGLLAIALTAVVGFFRRIHVDGVLDVHLGRPAPFWFFLAEGVIDWLCLTLFLGIAALVLSRSRVRLIDLAGMQALARAPQLLAVALLAVTDVRCIVALAKGGSAASCGPSAIVAFVLLSVAMLVGVVWMVALMYRAFAVACNVSGGRGAAGFIPALLLAEVLSKILIVGLLPGNGSP